MRQKVCLWLVFALGLLLSSCVTEDHYDNTPRGNFDALWRVLDSRYCFFTEKAELYGVDWNEVYSRYARAITPNMTSQQLFEVCGDMIRELRDGHVNLVSGFDIARYWDWYEKYPSNFSDILLNHYLGTDYRITSGIRYRIFSDNIGYIYCPSFDVAIGDGNLSAIFAHLALCNGVIVDIRNNSGGLLTSAEALAGSFTNEEKVGAYICHKTGPSHDAFSTPQPIRIKPSEGLRWQKPVVVLTNRQCYSAANTFVAYMRACSSAVIMGARTGGGGGMPFSYELPNGWSLRLSACPVLDAQKRSIESGIDPDIVVNLTDEDRLNNRDTMIEAARTYLNQSISNIP